MPCPFCRHTMQNIGLNKDDRDTFWCPRCGTLLAQLKADPAPDGTPQKLLDISIPSLPVSVRTAETQSVLTCVDGKTMSYAIPSPIWGNCCEAVGVRVHTTRDPNRN